jgi:hypothetical protein
MQGIQDTAKAFALAGMFIATTSAADNCDTKTKNFTNALSASLKVCNILYENETRKILKGTSDIDKIRECILSEIEMITLQIGASPCLLEKEFPPVGGSDDLEYFAFSSDNIEYMQEQSKAFLTEQWDNLIEQLIFTRGMSPDACFIFRSRKILNIACPQENKEIQEK